MEFKQFGNNYVLRLDLDEKLVETLTKFCKEQGIKLGSLHGLGAVHHVELAHYRLDNKEYSGKTYDDPREIASLHGNISEMDGDPYFHIHGVFSNNEMKTVAGHVKDFTVGPTCEIVIVKIDGAVGRRLSDKIGLNLLEFN